MLRSLVGFGDVYKRQIYISAFVFVAWRMMRHIITDRSKEAILWKSITHALLLLVDMFLYGS